VAAEASRRQYPLPQDTNVQAAGTRTASMNQPIDYLMNQLITQSMLHL
jgi:hypothetical protein